MDKYKQPPVFKKNSPEQYGRWDYFGLRVTSVPTSTEYKSIEAKGTSIQYRTKGILSGINIQSFISNTSVPKSLDELQYFIYEHGCFNVEDILNEEEINWTAPPWAKIGDIVFFMHAKYAKSHLTALRTELNNKKQDYTSEEYDTMMQWIARGLTLHKQYGGKIFAIAKVSGLPEHITDFFEDDSDVKLHWSSKIYADMDDVYLLENPVDISEFNEIIRISRQSSITPVFGSDFDALRKIIKSKNEIPRYFEESIAASLPLSKINSDNWYTLSNEYRRSFMLETQFRNFYVNHLLREISDIKTIYKECRCRKSGIPDSFIDNVIKINGRYLPVEVKLSVACQADINKQVAKYCDDEYIIIDNKNKKRFVAKTYI